MNVKHVDWQFFPTQYQQAFSAGVATRLTIPPAPSIASTAGGELQAVWVPEEPAALSRVALPRPVLQRPGPVLPPTCILPPERVLKPWAAHIGIGWHSLSRDFSY